MAAITLARVRKEFRGAVAVRDLSLAIADGEFVSLVGPSGCGKSTTLNLIAGLEAPTSGTISIDGEDVTSREPGARDLAMVFQSYALYPHLDVRRNLEFPLRVARLSRAEIDRRVAEAADLLGLGELLSRKPRELSGGQRQRVALGRALVRRPRAFLFDEPLSNLDAGLRLSLRTELKLLHERLRATFLYVTHDQAEAMTLSSRIVVMERGEVQQVAAPREIYDAPVNRFVAEFFGAPKMNVLAPALLGLDPSQGALAGVRPEDVLLGEEGVAARVLSIELTGAESWVTLELAGGARLVARASPTFAARETRLRPRKVFPFSASGVSGTPYETPALVSPT